MRKHKKIRIIVLGIVIVAAVAVGLWKISNASTKDTKATESSNKTEVVAATSAVSNPFSYQGTDGLTGYDVELPSFGSLIPLKGGLSRPYYQHKTLHNETETTAPTFFLLYLLLRQHISFSSLHHIDNVESSTVIRNRRRQIKFDSLFTILLTGSISKSTRQYYRSSMCHNVLSCMSRYSFLHHCAQRRFTKCH